jgi:dipeptidyl aminopeptidase/acylaminoacyl peptidase
VAQAPQKKLYSTALDSLWSQDTNLREISKDGRWAAFIEEFSVDEKVFWLVATDGSKKIQLIGDRQLHFLPNSEWLVCIDSENTLITLNLNNYAKRQYSNISTYTFSPDGKHIAMQRDAPYQVKEMLILNLQTQRIDTLKGVGSFVWHPSRPILFGVRENRDDQGMVQYDMESGKSGTVIMETHGTIQHLNICPSGKALTFHSSVKESNQLNYYDISAGTLKVLSNDSIGKNSPNLRISNKEIYLAAEGEKVLFYLQDSTESIINNNTDSQIWNTDDPWIAPRMEQYRKQEASYFLTAWYPKTGLLREIESKTLPSSAMLVDEDFALVYNPLQYEPQYKLFPDVELFIKSIVTGNIVSFCKKQYIEGQFVTISPEGQFIAFFRDRAWWIYDIHNGITTNITEDLSVYFHNTELQNAGDPRPYGIAGWLSGDTRIIVYDQFDIWAISPDGRSKKRITHGREENVRYRIYRNYSQIEAPITVNSNFSTNRLNSKKNIFLEMFNLTDYTNGIAVWNKNSHIVPLFWEEGKIDQVFWDGSGEWIVYRTQRFDQPICIKSYHLKNRSKILLYQTNVNLLEYDLGRTELIEYVLDNGTKMNGSLVYPAHYIPKKTYPMIVKIYERESTNILNFEAPGCPSENGFNLLDFVTNGYFVLYPDISYEMGSPGISALNSVKAAVEKAFQEKEIDKDRIGLIGHSFGGYETTFIITQTDMFAAAVAGAAVTNLVNYYHEVDWDMVFPQMWRMENQQGRFGNSYYHLKADYLRNSPLENVERVSTPLLLWTGKMDTNVNWSQSVQMFLALKRLGKTSKMLLYENESHVLTKRKNQLHLDTTIFNWMETYVKKNDKKTVSRS